jgi:hypothetical protein
VTLDTAMSNATPYLNYLFGNCLSFQKLAADRKEQKVTGLALTRRLRIWTQFGVERPFIFSERQIWRRVSDYGSALANEAAWIEFR